MPLERVPLSRCAGGPVVCAPGSSLRSPITSRARFDGIRKVFYSTYGSKSEDEARFTLALQAVNQDGVVVVQGWTTFVR